MKSLKELRQDLGIPQQMVASLLGVHYHQVGKYERGESRPRPELHPLYAKLLGVTMLELEEAFVESGIQAKARVDEWLKEQATA